MTNALRARFGLTGAETRIALKLLEGKTLKVAAQELGITYETVRCTLKGIFHKTGTRRQVQLVVLLLQVQQSIAA